MANSYLQVRAGNNVYKMTFGLFFLFCGCSIYLLFRSETINIYNWCSKVGMSEGIDFLRSIVDGWAVPSFVKYNLPDGLYCAAYILMMDAIWGKQNGMFKYIMISIIPFAAITYEVLQYFRVMKGTFDVCDLICYAIPVIIYTLFETYRLTK